MQRVARKQVNHITLNGRKGRNNLSALNGRVEGVLPRPPLPSRHTLRWFVLISYCRLTFAAVHTTLLKAYYVVPFFSDFSFPLLFLAARSLIDSFIRVGLRWWYLYHKLKGRFSSKPPSISLIREKNWRARWCAMIIKSRPFDLVSKPSSESVRKGIGDMARWWEA